MNSFSPCEQTKKLLQLSAVGVNCDCILAELDASVDPAHRRRLAELGLRKGCAFQVVQKSSAGAVVIKCGATRYAVDKKIAECMAVRVEQ